MRKRYRDKNRSCALCKPQKRGWARRWSARELAFFESSEREIAEALDSKDLPNPPLQRTGASVDTLPLAPAAERPSR
jgi:hypothetical protein